ncbi:MAG: (2Fe-2S)-binding protein [Candidatus Latescibacteria bacterium]|nr:(2Fe-2S)-binding protein [Candidatus Latescibacterota bacterium]
MAKHLIKTRINGEDYEVLVEPRKTLLSTLRDQLQLTGTKEGCSTGDCGACTVIMNGKVVTSCLVLAVEADGGTITTIEGIAADEALHPVQRTMIEKGGIQCGFCTPGMIVSAVQLLRENPTPSERDIRRAIAGNLCRCTGYSKIVEAVQEAAADLRKTKKKPARRAKAAKAA